MLQYKYRKQIVINRKQPRYKYIGQLPDIFVLSAISDCVKLQSSIELSKKNNHFIDQYDVLNHYDQRHTNISLPKIFDVFGKIHDLRYGILEPKKTIPSHIDTPDGYRFIAMLKGDHTCIIDGEKKEMLEGELWFINSSFEHSIINGNTKRIALLGKFYETNKLL